MRAKGWSVSELSPNTLQPAAATLWSFSTELPLTPIAPNNTPSWIIGSPPGKVMRPPFETSMPYRGFPGCDSLPSSPDPMVKKQAVFAFLMAISIEPTQASSMRMKARKLAPESTTAMHILVSRRIASLRAAAMAFSACSRSICMDCSPEWTGTRPLKHPRAAAVPGRKKAGMPRQHASQGLEAGGMGPLRARERGLFLDFPPRVVGAIHGSVATCSGQRRHRVAGKRLAAADARIFASAAGDEVRAAAHIRLRLVEIARVEGREDLVTVGVGEHAGAVNIFLRSGLDAQRLAARRHFVEHLLVLEVLGSANRLEAGDGPNARHIHVHQRPKYEMRDVRRRAFGRQVSRERRAPSEAQQHGRNKRGLGKRHGRGWRNDCAHRLSHSFLLRTHPRIGLAL